MHSPQQLELLQNYIMILIMLFGLPGVGLYLRKDSRYIFFIIVSIIIIIILIIFYIINNPFFFPDDTVVKNIS